MTSGTKDKAKGRMEKAAGGTSSNPITEHCSGTLIPRRVRVRIQPSAVISSNAMMAVNGFLRR